MDITNYLSGVTANILQKTQKKSISASTIGNAFIDLANITKAAVDTNTANVADITSTVLNTVTQIRTLSSTDLISGSTIYNDGSLANKTLGVDYLVKKQTSTGFTHTLLSTEITGLTSGGFILASGLTVNDILEVSGSLGTLTNYVSNTTLFTANKNLYNPFAATVGYYVQPLSGKLLVNSVYCASDYIAVSSNTSYARTNQSFMAFFNANRTYISGLSGNTNSPDTFITPSGASFVRVSMFNNASPTYQLELGTGSTTYIAYSAVTIKSNFIPSSTPAANSISTSAITNSAVTPLKTSFIKSGKNLYNPNAPGVVLGYYVNYVTGNLSVNASYNATDYIPVTPSTQYTINYLIHVAWYDSSKTFISGAFIPGTTVGTVTSPSNAVYLRTSVNLPHASNFQVEAGAVSTSFEAYNYTFSSDDNVPFTIGSTSSFSPQVDINLPSVDYAVAGVEKNIYFSNIIQSNYPLSEFDIDITCSKGQQFKDFFRVTPTNGDTGTFALSMVVNFSGSPIASASGNLIITSATTSATRKILMVGDSTLAGGQVLSPALNDYPGNGYNVTFLGTQGSGSAKHEGRSGWRASDFSTSGRTLYKFNLSGVTVSPGINAVYSNNGSQFTVSEVNLSSGSGYINTTLTSGTNQPIASGGTITKVSGSGDATINYASSAIGGGNPFWNNGTNLIDFQNYLTTNSYSMSSGDLMIIHLGINDMFSYTDDAAATSGATAFIANIETIMNAAKAAVSGLKFGICLPIAPSNSQDAFAANYSNGQTLKRYDRNRNILIKALIANYDTSAKRTAGYYLIAYNGCTDRVNNYQVSSAVPVNARNTGVTVIRQSNGVHPDTSGYYQMGDMLYSFIKYLN